MGRLLRPVTVLPNECVLVRTWFGDEDAWQRLVTDVQTPSEDGFLATVTFVDDAAFEGMTAEGLAAAQADSSFVSFLADELALSSDGYPIPAVWVFRGTSELEHQPFRVVATELWGVENNINLRNMDWDDFARSVDDDGIFRGF
jgi:hypothetical protein